MALSIALNKGMKPYSTELSIFFSNEESTALLLFSLKLYRLFTIPSLFIKRLYSLSPIDDNSVTRDEYNREFVESIGCASL